MKEAHHQALQTLTANMHRAYWDKTKSHIGGGEFSPQEMGVALQALMEMRDEHLHLVSALQRLYADYKALAEIFDYPWDFMPEKGRNTMRENVRAVLDAAIAQQKGGV